MAKPEEIEYLTMVTPEGSIILFGGLPTFPDGVIFRWSADSSKKGMLAISEALTTAGRSVEPALVPAEVFEEIRSMGIRIIDEPVITLQVGQNNACMPSLS